MRLPARCTLLLLLASTSPVHARVLSWFSSELRAVEREIAAATAALDATEPPPLGQTVTEFGYQHLQVPVPPPTPPWLQLDLRQTQTFEIVALVPAVVEYQTQDRRGAYGFPRRFRLDASDDPEFRTFVPLFVHTESDYVRTGFGPLVIKLETPISARYLRLTVTRMAEENGWHFYALAEMFVLAGNHNVALHASVSASSTVGIGGRWHLTYLVDGRSPLGPPIRRAALAEFDALFASSTPAVPEPWMSVDLEQELRLEEVRLHPLHSWQGADVPGFRFPLRWRLEVDNRPDFATARTVAEQNQDFPNPGNNPVTLRISTLPARFVRLVATKMTEPNPRDFALSELEVYANGRNVSRGRPVRTSDFAERPKPRPPALLTDGLTSLGALLELPAWLELWDRRTRLQRELASLEARRGPLAAIATRRATAAGMLGVLAVVGGTAALGWQARRRRQREMHAMRTRLARDLHDEIGSNLAGIAVLSETAALHAAGKAPQAAGEFREIQQFARESAEALREVLWLVGAPQESGIELAHHLRRVAGRLLPRTEIVWHGLDATFPEGWPADARRELFLFFKEALTNVARHANASRVEITFAFAPTFELRIRDDGVGFAPDAAAAGLGLGSLRSRALALGGSVDIVSAPGQGTELRLRAPMRAAS